MSVDFAIPGNPGVITTKAGELRAGAEVFASVASNLSAITTGGLDGPRR